MQRFSNTSAVVLNLRKTPTSVKKFTEEDVKNLARHYGDKLLLCPHTGMMLFDGFIIKYAEDALGVDGLCNGRKNMEQLMLVTNKKVV